MKLYSKWFRDEWQLCEFVNEHFLEVNFKIECITTNSDDMHYTLFYWE